MTETWEEHLRKAREKRLRDEQMRRERLAKEAADRALREEAQRREREERLTQVGALVAELQKAIAALRSESAAETWTFHVGGGQRFEITRAGEVSMYGGVYHNRTLDEVVQTGDISPGLISALLARIASDLVSRQ